jgi:hypothetical protein
MNRSRSIWVALFAALFAITTLSAGDADARRKREKKAPAAAKVNTKALKELMGAFKFGMSKDGVIKVVTKQVTERYAEKISATSDVYKQDKLRRDRGKEIKRFKKSFVEFKGKKSGWDVSIIDDQFGHKTDESMMVLWETHQGRNQRRFFFFHDGRLYKMFIALDTSALKESQRTFAFFRTLMEQRFGTGEVNPRGITWKARSFTVEALDKQAFYGAFCLIISDPARSVAVAEARERANRGPRQQNSVIKSITEGEGEEGPGLDDGGNTIDNVLRGN